MPCFPETHEDLICTHENVSAYKRICVGDQLNQNVLGGQKISACIIKAEVESVSGSRYTVTFRDARSGFIWAYAIRSYYNAVELIKKIINAMQKQTKTSVKMFDLEHNFEGLALQQYETFIAQKQIGSSRDSNYLNRVELWASSLKSHELQAQFHAATKAANLPKALWDEILDTIVYDENCVTVYPGMNCTVFEDFTYRKPCVSRFRIIGAEAYAVPFRRQSPKACVFLGYCEIRHQYKFYRKYDKQIFMSKQFHVFQEFMLSANVIKTYQQPNLSVADVISANNGTADYLQTENTMPVDNQCKELNIFKRELLNIDSYRQLQYNFNY